MRVDFSELECIQDYKDNILVHLNSLDIGILVFNPTQVPKESQLGAFKDFKDIFIEEQLKCNVLSIVYSLRVLLNKLIARDKRCGVLILSQMMSGIPMPG